MKNLIIIIALVFSANLFAQIHDPVKWSTSVEKISDTEYELVATAVIQGEWHLYSQNVPENGPIPTSFSYKSNGKFFKKGNTKEEEGQTIDDRVFNMRIKYFGKKAVFKQRVKLKSATSFKINVVVEFMVCNDTQCLPPKEVDLVFIIE
jgi:thiol:disulfide interchange protein DsbD